jgi:GDPmannose 4,6-dehydratase
MKTAIITGITGQDGSYLAELLLEKNYLVVGLHRRTSTNTLERVAHLLNNPNFKLEECDLTDPAGIFNVINTYKPEEFYNLAAQSHVGTSFSQPTTTFEVDTVGVVNILEAIRKTSPDTKFYQASTSEMYGFNYNTAENGDKYQDENTQLLPQSPYGVAKLASHNMVRIYRSAYGLFCCSGTLFNHESPRRGENFVTRKITKWLGEFNKWSEQARFGSPGIVLPEEENYVRFYGMPLHGPEFPKLRLGNIKAYRDWGHAKDYVRAMWMMLQQEVPDDYVIATGETHSVEDFLKIAFGKFDLDYKNFIIIDPQFYRPAEVDYLRGISNKALLKLGWIPEISFSQLVEEMVTSDQMV